MASREYCSSVGDELKFISEKFHKLSASIDCLSTGEKQRMYTQIEGFHILMTEIDDRVYDLSNSCSMVDGPFEKATVNVPSLRSPMNKSKGVHFDYDFGG